MDSTDRGGGRQYEGDLRSRAEGVNVGDKYYLKREVSSMRSYGLPFPEELLDARIGTEVVVTECDASSPSMRIEIQIPRWAEGRSEFVTIPFVSFFEFFRPSQRQGSGDPMKMGDERMLGAVDPEGGFKGRKNDSFTVDDIRRIAFEKVAARIRGGNVRSGGSREPEES